MPRDFRRVEAVLKASHRTVSIEVFAKKDPIRAAKRFVKDMGYHIGDFDWTTAKVLEGRDPNKSTREIEGFEADILRGILTGGIKSKRIV